tara:strand:- start:786 stop:1505 length:720 start_codon:yes stop_codon:yes gene_type:complete
MAETYFIENVEALWPKIDRTYVFDQKVKSSVPCDPRDNGASFSIQFRMDSDTAKALFSQMKAAWLANREKSWPEKLTMEASSLVRDDDGTVKGTSNIKGAYKGEVTARPLQVDSQGTPMPDDFQLTTGSTVSIAVTFTPYHMSKDNWGVSLRLKAVQVIKLASPMVRNPFGVVEGGFVLEDNNPFAKTAPVKSNNVLEAAPADDDDGFDEEPVKKTAKKAETAPSESADINAIIDDWDD